MLSVKPTNDLELILAAQTGTIHQMTMRAVAAAGRTDHTDNYQTYSNQKIKLSRVFMGR